MNKIPSTCKISNETKLLGTINMGENCVIEGVCTLENVTMGDNVHMIDSSVKDCTLASNVCIKNYAVVENTQVQENTTIEQSNIIDSKIGKECKIGPFAHLRPKSILLGYNKIGAFVQVKNSTIGEHSTASHLAYIGDATVGKYVNIGCGVVFVNYDGKEKYHTTVGDYCFIGCHTNLIAPITMGNHCFIAAGTTLTKDVPEGSFAIGRNTPTIKTNKRLEDN